MNPRRHTGWLLGITLIAAAGAAQKIPEVHGKTFADTPVSLPEALQGKVGILVIGFSTGARDALTVWGKRLAADYYDSPTVLYYEMPVLADVPKLMRGLVTGKIKASVSDRGKPHFIPLTEDEPAWRTLVHYEAPDDAYLLLIDGQGTVCWQTHGPATDATYATMKQQVATLQAQTAQPTTR